MSELSTKYTPSDIEEKWYSHWEKSGYFHNEPDKREPFSIVIPPPNVTGVLHMGHMLNNTIQDALTRKARLEGKNAIWIPGTDHASIATEAKVVRMLRERGIKKSDLTREEFMAYAWEWKEKYGGIILQQLRKLGSSCDWERTAFTMDEGYSKDVIHTFVDLYRKGKLYRDYRMVNWDCEAKTVLSNEEVIHGEEQAQLFYVKYIVEGSDTEGVTIATQRPETIMADTAVAVHPNDPRYAHLKGKKVIVPLVNRAIPIIFDEYVDMDFGTGALKVTPAHDPNDYELGKKHGLEVIDLLNDDGTLNEKCGISSLIGVDRFDARRHMKKLLSDAGNLVKIEDYKTNIGRSERTNTVVEPKMSLQWYVNMKAIAEPALQAVETDEIDFYPKSFKNTYRYWMDNIRDWCISRQLWWGHRIPAYYYNGETFVAETAEEALILAQAKYPSVTAADLKQDEDVLDTWASSWLWPISTLNGFKNSKEFDYYYPTSVLVTGWDIIFLWVARMAMAGFEWKQERPFKAVYLTGMVRDKQRRKMSKSLGNSPDALQLIEDFGADGVRFGMLASSPAGGDLLFDEKLCEQGRNFCNKLWNALRLVKGWEIEQGHHSEVENLAAAWFDGKMSSVLIEIEENFKQFRLSEALMGLYNFIWDDYCSWYLEMIKPEYGKPIDRVTLEKTEVIFRKLMAMLHPFMPFITEEIWQQLDGKNTEGADLCVAKYPKATEFDADLIKKVEAAKDIISKIREIRNNKGLKQREPLVVKYQSSETAKNLLNTEGVRSLIKKLGVLESLQTTDVDVPNAVSFVSGTDKFYVVLNQKIDVEEEREKLTKELVYQQGFLKSVSAKLSNERFVANAKPEIVASEQQKQADALARIKILEEGLTSMNIENQVLPETPTNKTPIDEPTQNSNNKPSKTPQMKIEFIGQGIKDGQSVGHKIMTFLSSGLFDKFTAISAFASQSAILGIKEVLENNTQLKDISIIVGIDLKGTSKEALELLLEFKEINSSVIYTTTGIIFHPKIYVFEGKSKCTVIVGSSNLTTQGLFQNIEASLLIDFELPNEIGEQLLADITTYIDVLSNNKTLLSQDLIDELVKGKIVPLEKERKEVQGKQYESDNLERDPLVWEQVKQVFPSIIRNKIPLGFKIKKEKLDKKYDYIEEDLEFDIEKGALVWQKHNLPSSDAQQVKDNTNPTNVLRMGSANYRIKGQLIDKNVYFKETVFGKLIWKDTTRNDKNPLQETISTFDIFIDNQYFGVFILRISHDPERIADQANIPTTIHWSPEVVKILKENNIVGKRLSLYMPLEDGKPFTIEIL